MKLLCKNKDGGPESNAWAYWLFESKFFGSIAILKFVGKSREAYHTHAFNSISWLLKGKLKEEFIDAYRDTKVYIPSIKPILTTRNIFHKVSSESTSWVLTFRGPWSKHWREFTNKNGEYGLRWGRTKI